METLDSIGIIIMLGLAALKEHWLYFVCVCVCSASVNALQIVFSNILYVSTAKWEIPQIFKEDRLLVHI